MNNFILLKKPRIENYFTKSPKSKSINDKEDEDRCSSNVPESKEEVQQGPEESKYVEQGALDITSAKNKTKKARIPSCFQKIGTTGRRKIRCRVCCKHHNIIHIHKESDHVPQICSEGGSEIRQKYIDNNLQYTMHLEAVKAEKRTRLEKEELSQDRSTLEGSTS